MAVAKVIEVSASSPKSFEDAIEKGVEKAAETLHGVRGAWVSEQSAIVEDGKVTEYRVTMRISFLLD